MTELLFQPYTVVSLALLVLNVAVLGYLLSIRRKSAATWWLVMAFAAYTVAMLSEFVWSTLMTDRLAIIQALDAVYLIATCMGAWALLGFAYRFLDDSLAGEARRVLVGTAVALAAVLAYVTVLLVTDPTSDSIWMVHTALSDVLVVWTLGVFLRKRRLARRDGGPDARRAAQAYTTFAVLYGLYVGSTALYWVSTAGAVSISVVRPIGEFLNLGFAFGYFFVYLTYAPEPTTLQAKLVGVALVTALASVAAVTFVAFPHYVIPDALVEMPQREALRYTPDGAGGYTLAARPYTAPEPRGRRLALRDDDETTVALGFAFPFYGQAYTEAVVDDDPIVAFGEALGPYQNLPLTETPMILALGLDIAPDQGGGVFLDRAPDRVTVTWHRVPVDGSEVPVDVAEGTATAGLTLHADGVIDVVVAEASPGGAVARGIKPAGQAGAALSRTAPLGAGLPVRIAPGAPYLEHYYLVQRRRTHERMRGLIELMLALSALVVVVLPLLFRSTLVRPLRQLQAAVRRVEEGDLEAEVPVGVQDEVGYLATRFNRMTASLRRYSQEMEGLVAERTAELEEAQGRLVQQEKMASLGALTAGIAHEIKNPLNFVTNFAGLSREAVAELRTALDAGDDEEAAALLDDLALNTEKIEAHGQRADAIVKAMMEHARGSTGERRAVALNALVEEYAGLAYHALRARRPDAEPVLDFRLDPDAGEVVVVPQQIGRVLVNLVDNAFDAVAEQAGSEIGAYAPTVTVSTARANGQATVRVEDNGPGIAPAAAAKVFEPFYTTKPAGEGTGLGLSLAYDVVTQGHGGALEVGAGAGGGAAFTLTLPTSA
ncbi:sensor histidine kinase [Rubrivirga sp. IMCC45206]|uniref:sensor histidine kinase n=1 Tax=Rubrivirga sp. IMCC45206 TaxID=3391614 RepID=UPI00398FD9C2